MYQRFRIWVDSDLAEQREQRPFNPPPAPPGPANLAKAAAPQNPGLRQGGRENGHDDGRGEEFDAGIEGVYIISVAARILDMHPQTLRKYERLGLINPGRTVGMLRLYSREDIRKVFLIRHLMEDLGLNLAGVEFALNLVENLHGFKHYLKTISEGTGVEPVIEPAMAQLFRNLNLPAPESQG
jgi:MerR family transcriptional regulator/heat shock protein HspR